MIGQVIFVAFKLLGALALFMFGMQLSSDGIQRAAGDRLQRTVNFMTRNRVVSVLTGMLVTVLIQSSSATSVMVVSFVNAGLLSLFQAIGVLMGAHVGTTLTGWIVAAAGIRKFSVAALAVPLFGVGFFVSIAKTKGKDAAWRDYGVALMGFALIFMGLDFLANAIPDPSAEALSFLESFSTKGAAATGVCLLAGVVFTMLINASSATLAITVGLAAKGIISFPMAAAIILGANIGTTFDALLVCIGASRDAQRAAFAHSFLSVLGVAWVLVIFKPFLDLVDWITPGALSPATMGAHIAMLHTLFNTANTLVFLPFIRQYADLLVRLLKDKPEAAAPKESYSPKPLLPIAELNLVQARADLIRMAGLAERMYGRFADNLFNPPDDMAEARAVYERDEALGDAMYDGLSRFLLGIAEQEITDKTRDNLGVLLRVVTDLENITDACLNLGVILENAAGKKLRFDKTEIKMLEPYAASVRNFLDFVKAKIDKNLNDEELALALRFETEIDASRAELKRLSRKRLKAGANVKVEFVFIDVIRYMEKIGDFSYSIAESLRALR